MRRARFLPERMFDSIDAAQIPAAAKYAAGYLDGHWPSFHAIRERMPHAHVIPIAVNHTTPALILDIELGDATPDELVAWWHLSTAAGYKHPGPYASLSQMPGILAGAADAGITRSHMHVWTAHWTGQAHICDRSCDSRLTSPAGATQYADSYLGLNCDVSAIRRSFVGPWHP